MEVSFTLPQEKESAKTRSVGVILPTLNEEGNIFQLCLEIWDRLQTRHNVSIIVVDDNSQDSTVSEALRARCSGAPVVVIENNRRLGLGASIGRAIAETDTDIVAVMDADFTHSVEDLSKMLEMVEHRQFVSGSRFGGEAQRFQHSRYSASRVYQMILRPVLGLQLNDILGGFWVTERESVSSVPFQRIFRGYGDYYFRLLSYLDRSGILIKEFSATYRKRFSGKSKSKPLKMIILYLSKAVWWRIRLRVR